MDLERDVLIQGMQYEITKALAAQKESGFIQYDPCDEVPVPADDGAYSVANTKFKVGVRKPLTPKEKSKRLQKRRLAKQARRAGR